MAKSIEVDFVSCEQLDASNTCTINLWILDDDGSHEHVVLDAKNIIAVLDAPVHKAGHIILSVKPGADKALPSLVCYTCQNLHDQTTIAKYKPGDDSAWTQRHKSRSVRLDFVISIASGSGQAKAFFEQLVLPLLGALGLTKGKDFDIHMTESATSVTDLTTSLFVPRANQGIKQNIVLFSGDGGVIDLVNALYISKRTDPFVRPRLTLLPFGTGNALANSYRCNNDNTLGLSTFFRAKNIRPLPLMKATFSPGAKLLTPEQHREQSLALSTAGQPTVYGAVVCSWGLHASLVCDSDTAAYRQHGSDRFLLAAKALLYPSTPEYHGDVSYKTLDGQEALINRDSHSYILATLVSDLERGFTVSPASRDLDGVLRLVDIPPVSGDEFMAIADAAYDGGKHVVPPHACKVGYRPISSLRIAFGDSESRGRIVCVDGKIVRVEKGGWLVVDKLDDGVLDILHF